MDSSLQTPNMEDIFRRSSHRGVKCRRELLKSCDLTNMRLYLINRTRQRQSYYRTLNRNLYPPYSSVLSWLGGSVVERRSLIGEISLVCTGPAADG